MDAQGRYSPRMRLPEVPTPPLFDGLVPAYLAHFATQVRPVPRTLARRRRQLVDFTRFLTQKQVQQWTQVTPNLVPEFLLQLKGISPRTRCTYAYALRGFLRWAYLRGDLPVDLSCAVPRIRSYRLSGLPDTLTDHEVQLLLGSVERGCDIGKRDYALLLLSARYGMRPSDVRQLSLDHIAGLLTCGAQFWLHSMILPDFRCGKLLFQNARMTTTRHPRGGAHPAPVRLGESARQPRRTRTLRPGYPAQSRLPRISPAARLPGGEACT